MTMNPVSGRMRVRTQGGYSMLLAVIILGAIGAVTAVTLILSGLASSRNSLSFSQSAQAAALAAACAEEALEQIRESTSYAGNGSLTLSTGSCSYAVQNTGGQSRTITASSTVGTSVRKTKVLTTASTPKIVVSTWQSVADF